MSTKIVKVKKVSTFIKWFLLVSSTLGVVYLFQQLLIEGQIRYYTDPAFDNLWQSSTENKTLLALLTAPVLMLTLLGVYFSVKVLSLFQKGVFYSPANFIGYFGFVWSKLAIIAYELVILVVFAKMNAPSGEATMIALNLILII